MSRRFPRILRPGAITAEMIGETTGLKIESSKSQTRASGLLDTHYAPKAKVIIEGAPNPGDGFIALSEIPTPIGSIRLAAPETTEKYAQILYQSLRLGDQKGLKNIFVLLPKGSGLALAVRDRIQKAANSIIH